MIEAKLLNSHSQDIDTVFKLYEYSFPENERMDKKFLLRDDIEEKEILAFYEDNVFFGFCMLLSYKNITHILYFATIPSIRNKGYGSKILEYLQSFKPNNSILADIEKPNIDNDQRTRRKEFYLRNSFKESNVEYTWQDEAYEIVYVGKELNNEIFWGFWNYFMHYFRGDK